MLQNALHLSKTTVLGVSLTNTKGTTYLQSEDAWQKQDSFGTP